MRKMKKMGWKMKKKNEEKGEKKEKEEKLKKKVISKGEVIISDDPKKRDISLPSPFLKLYNLRRL